MKTKSNVYSYCIIFKFHPTSERRFIFTSSLPYNIANYKERVSESNNLYNSDE